MDNTDYRSISNDDEPLPVLHTDTPSGSSADVHKGSVQERLLTSILQQILPAGSGGDDSDFGSGKGKGKEAMPAWIGKPQFSLPIMSANFRRFSARIGVVFVFQNKVIKLLSWRKPTQTASLLAVYSLVCLDPNLLIILPMIGLLFFVMVPAYLVRHPPPPHSDPMEVYAIQGPASAPPANIRPARDFSKEFFRNMRDLQNSMEDFSAAHDLIVENLGPVTNFSDERVSSTLFLGLFIATCAMFFLSQFIPWRAIFFALGWAAIVPNHPTVARYIASFDKKSSKTSDGQLEKAPKKSKSAMQELDDWMSKDIILDEGPEIREVEMFELQRQVKSGEWEPWLFSTSPYDPLSPLRVSGSRPKGARFFDDVQPPRGWEWGEKQWELDAESREWVEYRLITGVEVETDGDRWVYDLSKSLLDNEDYAESSSSGATSPRRDWEESTGLGAKGEWRRRRWARVVRRKVLRKEFAIHSSGRI